MQTQHRITDFLSRGDCNAGSASAGGSHANLVIKSDNMMTTCKPIPPFSRLSGSSNMMGEWAVIDNARQYISFQGALVKWQLVVIDWKQSF